MDFKKRSLALHKKYKGKLEIASKVPLKNKNDLSMAYTPGVAEVCRIIVRDKRAMYTHTMKSNTVAIVTDGSAVLGLGNIGPEAAMPVMEGKAILFKHFANVDAFPICLSTQNTDEIVDIVKKISIGFGGINIEDIAAPRCFEIEERLKAELNIPVFHDDQHGTAIVVLSALLNSLKVVGKEINKVKVVINGAGAAAMAIAHILLKAGVQGKNFIMVDSKGVIYKGRPDLNKYKDVIARKTNFNNISGSLEEAIVDRDVFIGVSAANVLKPEWISKMADDPIVFAMANPDPEILYEAAIKTKIAIFGTGRSDYPNQINNVLAFPGIFRGALDARVPQITDEMKLAAAKAIASLVSKKELSAQYIIPKPFDPRVAKVVARAVAVSFAKSR